MIILYGVMIVYLEVVFCQGANLSRSSNPGMAIRAQAIKKLSQPMCWARKPVGVAAITRGTPMRLLNRAYCVAVKRLSVMLAI